jgi:hypothetical protein
MSNIKYFAVTILGVLAAVGVSLTAVGSASAYINEDIVSGGNPVGISISPTDIRLSLDPGTVKDGQITVRSTGTETQEVFATIAPFSVSGAEYTQNFSNKTARNEIVNWTSINIEGCDINSIDEEKGRIYFTMRPKEECKLSYRVSVPDNAPGGAQYAALFIQQSDTAENKQSGIGINTIGRIGIVMFGTISGETHESGELVSQKIPFWVFSGPIETLATVRNSGNIDFDTTYEIEVFNLFGSQVYKSDPKSSIVMADTTRGIPVKWEESSIGIYNVKQTVSFLGGDPYIKEGLVICIPLWLLLVILAAIAIFVVAFIYGRKKANAGKRRKF